MTEHTYEPPPAAIGETRSYLGGASNEAVYIERREPGLLHIRVAESPEYLGTLIDHGGGLYTLPSTPNGLRADNLTWAELLDNL